MAFATNPKIVNSGGDFAPILVEDLLEADSQTFKEGQFVYLSSEAVTEVASNGQTIYGIALADATNVTSGNTEIKINAIRPTDVVKMLITNGSGTASSSSNCSIGVAYAIYSSGTVTSADYSDTSNDAITFVSHCYDAAGDKTNYGLFSVLPAVCQYTSGS